MTASPPNPSPQPSALSLDVRAERALVEAGGARLALLVQISARAASATTRRAPLDVAFVLDRSGSMTGEKLALVKEAVDIATGLLRDADRAALVAFDTAVDVLQPLALATGRGKAALRLALHGIDAGSSTNLSGGWLAGCQELAGAPAVAGDNAHRLRRALLLTDGLANEGITDPHELMHHATQLRLRGVTTTTLGVGLGFDEVLLSGMAEAGGGNFQFIVHNGELRQFFAREIGELLAVVCIAPRLELTLPPGVRGRLLNAFPASRSGKTITVDLRDLAAGDEVPLIFDLEVAADERDTTLQPSCRLTWVDPVSDRRETRERPGPAITRATAGDARHAPVDADVAELAALERASRDRREAVRLDREGQYAASRAMFSRAATTLSAAPQSLAVRAELRDRLSLAAADATSGLAEDVRKQRLYDDQRRSRGRRDE